MIISALAIRSDLVSVYYITISVVDNSVISAVVGIFRSINTNSDVMLGVTAQNCPWHSPLPLIRRLKM